MNRCAFLTMDSMEGYVNDDALALDQLNRSGWDASLVAWRSEGVDWASFDLVVVRSTWDYQKDPDLFLHTLEEIDRSGTHLQNPLPVIKWNIHKGYLQDLEEHGVYTVPTIWGNHLSVSDLDDYSSEFAPDPFVIKPTVGASAQDTFLIHPAGSLDEKARLVAAFADREYLVQPFMKEVIREGEYSLFFFNGQYSHAILKTPKAQDFRSQEEYGSRIKAVTVDEKLLKRGVDALNAIDRPLLYARVDLIRDEAGDFALMELELIEPSLYFRTDPQSPVRFVQAVDRMTAALT